VEPAPSTSTEPAPSTSTTADQLPQPSYPVKLSLRKGFAWPHCEQIQRRLDFVVSSKAEMQKRYLMKLEELRAKDT